MSTKTDTIADLVASYDTYVDSRELRDATATDAPATTAYCVAASLGFLGSLTFQLSC
ncbi:hypothetical protein [Microbacterium hibisci]|uniref:hypothetical protein n=1 Tax=Microbacterium hibisci TaxID=2036000 RepID=UPI00194257CF|nr:hypothetical protein [Microbacterium hibisci]